MMKLPEQQRSILGLALCPYWNRIVYETLVYLRRRAPSISLDIDYEQNIAASRHSMKLFDDTKRGVEGLIDWFEHVAQVQREAFEGHVRWSWLRWFAPDLGLFRMDGNLVMTSHVANYHVGLEPEQLGQITSDRSLLFGPAQIAGGVLAAVVRALMGREPEARLDLSTLRPVLSEDRKADRYLRGRYDPNFSLGMREALTAMEVRATISSCILTATEPNHEGAVFRARLISATHLLAALREVSQHLQRDADPFERLATVLNGDTASVIASQQVRRLRNVAMHYGLAPTTPVDFTLPMFGLVEHLVPGQNYHDLSGIVTQFLRETAALLSAW